MFHQGLVQQQLDIQNLFRCNPAGIGLVHTVRAFERERSAAGSVIALEPGKCSPFTARFEAQNAMALKQLDAEQVRTWTLEQKDRWWYENVWRGDMPQLTLRSAVTGMGLGGLLSP